MNRIFIMGRLTADPEVRTLKGGQHVAQFGVAVNRKAKDGEQTADFFNVVAWGDTADFASRYLNRGKLITIEGSMRSRRYTAKDGNPRTVWELVADRIYFAEPKASTEKKKQVDADDDLPFPMD